MMDFMRKTFLGLGAALVLSVPAASAATITLFNSSTQGVGNTADSFAAGYGANTPTGATWSVDPTWTPPPEGYAGQSQSPFNNTGIEGTQDYFTIGGVFGSNGALSPVSLSFATVQSSFTFLWGSIDSYNSVEFFLGAISLFSYSGTNLIADFGFDDDGPNFEEVALVMFDGFEGGFDKVKFTSPQAAFEMALPPVPVPAAGLLLLAALGGLTALRRRKSV